VSHSTEEKCLGWIGFLQKQLCELFHYMIVDFLTAPYCFQPVFKIPGYTSLCDSCSSMAALGNFLLPKQEATESPE